MKFIVKHNVLEIEEEKELCSGTINCLKMNVEFDAAWNGLTKEAIIIKEYETEGERLAIVNNQVCISRQRKGKYFIGFVGYRLEEGKKVFQLSTNLKTITYDKGAGEVEAKEAEDLPTPTQWEIYIAEIQKVINEANALDVELLDNVLTITRKDGTKHSEYVKGDKGEKGDAGAIKMRILDTLPETGAEDTLYFKKLAEPTDNNLYEEYVWIDNKWEYLGNKNIDIDLTDYQKKSELDEKQFDITYEDGTSEVIRSVVYK